MLVHGHLAEALQDAEDLAAFANIGGPGDDADVDRALRKELRGGASDGHGDVEFGGEMDDGNIWRCKKSDAFAGMPWPGSRYASRG